MEKHFLVLQPPFAEKYSFLVDDISNKSNWGSTTDIDKINYNRKLLGEDFNIDIKVNLLLSEKGGTSVLPLGRFITIIQLREDENMGRMTFFDFDTSGSKTEIEQMLKTAYSENIVDAWFKVYDILKKEFQEEDDNVALLKPKTDLP